MAHPHDRFPHELSLETRRYFLGLGAVGTAALMNLPVAVDACDREPILQDAIAKLDPWLTPAEEFRDVSRGKPIPHSLSMDDLAAAGLTRETWKLQVIADPDHPAKVRKPMSAEQGTALDFAGLMKLAEDHAVRVPKVMTCLNIGCPLGMGVWEGIPLRTVLWLTDPRENLRRVVYWGFHNNEADQKFQSSLPIDRVLEDLNGLPPVILAYKLNGDLLSPTRGGPVRMVVPEAYGFKSIKWLTTILLSNLFHANDTYANGNNDVDSTLKSFASTGNVPLRAKANMPLPVTGYAQVGTSGVSRVQVWLQPEGEKWSADDKYFQKAPWRDADLLSWEETSRDQTSAAALLSSAHGFDAHGKPRSWPERLTRLHWATLHPGLPAGKYTLRCRTVDAQGIGQPLPRPFQKSGHAAIEEVTLTLID